MEREHLIQPDNDSLLDWALYYADQGLKVFPLEHKLPLPGTNGFHDGTTNAKLIREWWSREAWNIGAVIPKGVVILDTDGAEAEQAMKALDWDVPSTLTSRSRRGYHRWYRADVQIARKIEIFPHIDLLTNGYVVLPPSKHLEGQYRWVGNFSKDAIADAPDWLLSYEKAEVRVEAGLEGDRLLRGIPEGERQVTLFRMACKYRGQGALSKEEATVLIDKMCRASNFTEQTAEYIVDRVWRNYPAGADASASSVKGKVWNLATLAKTNIERPKDFISNLLPQGVSMLSGDPKAGKSFLAGQISQSVATGSSLFGRQVKQQGGVFYIDAEQGEGFAVERWNNQTGGEIPPNIDIAFSWRRMDQGGLKDLEEYLAVSPHIRLVVIDTLSQFWPVNAMSTGNAYYQEAAVIAKISEIYKNWGVSLLLVHHNTKNNQGSMIKKAGGTMAITGGMHGYLVLSDADLPELKFDGKLGITGKNVESGPIDITFDPKQSKWIRRK